MTRHKLTASSLSPQKHVVLNDIFSWGAGCGIRLTPHVAEVAPVWHSSSHFLVLSKESQNYTELQEKGDKKPGNSSFIGSKRHIASLWQVNTPSSCRIITTSLLRPFSTGIFTVVNWDNAGRQGVRGQAEPLYTKAGI